MQNQFHSEHCLWEVMQRCSCDLIKQTYGKASLRRKDAREQIKSGAGPESLGHFHPWRYSRLGWKRLWAVLFPSWKSPTDFESRSKLEFGPALSEDLIRWPVDILFNLNYSMILWIQARSAAKLLSISVLLFSSLELAWLVYFAWSKMSLTVHLHQVQHNESLDQPLKVL